MGSGTSKAGKVVKGDRYKRINRQGNIPTTYAVYKGNELVKIVGTKAEAEKLTKIRRGDRR